MRRASAPPLLRWVALILGSVAVALLLAFVVADRSAKRLQAHLPQASLQELQALTEQKDHRNDPEVFYWLGVRLSEAKRDKDAVLALAKAVMLDPKSARTRYALGAALDEVGRPPEAEAQLKQAIALDPQAPKPYYVLGKMYGKYGRWEQAVETLKTAAEKDPNDIEAPFLLALSYRELAKTTHAPYREQELAVLKKLEPHASNDVRILRALAASHVFFNHLKEAADLYRRIVALDPNDINTKMLLGRSIAEQADTPEAFAEADRLLAECEAKEAKQPGVMMALGVLHFRRGDAAKAIPYLEDAIRKGVSEPEAWFYLGRAYAKLGRAEEAKRATATYTLKDRNRLAIRSLTMKLGFVNGETPEGRKEQDGLHLQLARTLMSDGQFKLASDHLNAILAHASAHAEARKLLQECESKLKSSPSPGADAK